MCSPPRRRASRRNRSRWRSPRARPAPSRSCRRARCGTPWCDWRPPWGSASRRAGWGRTSFRRRPPRPWRRRPAANRRAGSANRRDDAAWRLSSRLLGGLFQTGGDGFAGRERGARRLVLGLEPGHDVGGRRGVVDLADALARAPDVAPRLGLLVAAGAEIHLALVGHRQVVGIEAGRGDRALEVVAVHAGEEVGVDDLLSGAVDDAL